jgi:hypothetical protein
VPAGEPAVFYQDLRESVVFYSGRRAVILKKQDELDSFLNSPQPVFCFISIKTLDKVRQELHTPCYIVDREGFFALISNRKPPEGT